MDKLNIDQIAEDVSKQKPSVGGVIDKVGIEDLEIPIQFRQGEQVFPVQANVTAMVSLDKENNRGIHMSRIYFSLHKTLSTKELNLSTLKDLLQQLKETQKGLSHTSYLKLSWKWPVKRKALKSDSLEGWRCYPVFYEGTLKKSGEVDLVMGLQVTYSSTCPCSAGLARTLIQKKFKEDFDSSNLKQEEVFQWLGKEQSISATPHAQKSVACVKINVQEEKQSFIELIDEMEKTLGTPVQTAVKKDDEQEFAKLNSENLMFSEDAARRIKQLLDQKAWVKGFDIHIKHFESLHPFEVACHITKPTSG